MYFDKEAELSLVMHRAVLAHLHDNAKVITDTKEKKTKNRFLKFGFQFQFQE